MQQFQNHTLQYIVVVSHTTGRKVLQISFSSEMYFNRGNFFQTCWTKKGNILRETNVEIIESSSLKSYVPKEVR